MDRGEKEMNSVAMPVIIHRLYTWNSVTVDICNGSHGIPRTVQADMSR